MEDKNWSGSEEETDLKRGPWTVEEDLTLINYVAHHGEGRWNSLARRAGLNRSGKSCRLRWLNYLRPDVRRGNITLEEQLLILELHSRWGNRWSKIAQHLPGRTDNEIKNYWRTRVQKHAKQLKCDVNSKQFKDAVRYLWMPRLVERIQAQAAVKGESDQAGAAAATATEPVALAASSFPDTSYDLMISHHNNSDFQEYCSWSKTSPPLANHGSGIQNYSPENSSTVLSTDSFGTPVSDLTDCYNNYRVNDQDYYYMGSGSIEQSLIIPTGFDNDSFNQTGMDFLDQDSRWMSGGDIADDIWDGIDDIWLLQE